MKKALAITLEKLEGFEKPKIKLEQYVTPPSLAAEIVVNAKLIGDLNFVVDLGCGTGILAIASCLLNAKAIGIDVDLDALKIAKRNAAEFGVSGKVDFIVCDVKKFVLKLKSEKSLTTIMNPPFGIQRRHADRPFLIKAMEISNVIYTMHSAGSEKFVKKMCDENDFKITHLWKYKIPLKKTYSFHEKEFKYIAIEVYRLMRLD
ncbi:methyltransferase [Archaeoglobales archaeon]|nr:MAG: methyltransferase [Archaeoglobales archaeon]